MCKMCLAIDLMLSSDCRHTRVIMDRESGRSRGFAFVSFASSDEASNAIEGMNGQDLHGRKIRVDYAVEKSRGGFGGPGFRQGGGEFGNVGNFGSGGYGGGGGGYGYGGGGGGYGYGQGGDGYNAGTGGHGGRSSYRGGSYSGGSNFEGGNSGDFGADSRGDFSVSGGANGSDFFPSDNAGAETLEDNPKGDDNEPNSYANTKV
ncbi:glycine-rich RNA-binding protein 1-like isoform X2 [Rhodamnia argentea]|uniref:Glycine-rich RNA-binding protein 1-like isoform X2 n=1 Tax=Rhodamnia argentea TaxID=178133 RepID=A0A8B8QN85_9MYRT|nr:glycine-rich RNA-binding protein 1-like isoform X2 [Rhodamnia argentea]